MICNKILYDNELLITIYHKGFLDEIDTKSRNINEECNNKTITFLEYYEKSDDILNNQFCIADGFLDTKSKYNPYKNGSNCAMYKRYIGKLPNSIFELVGNIPQLKLSLDELDKIFDFIKKYTSLDISQDVTLFGNILVYEPRTSHIKKSKTDKFIEFEQLEPNTLITISFLKNDIVISSNTSKSTCDSDIIRINAPDEWNCADISMYKDNELYYKNPDFSLIRSFTLNMSMRDVKKISLNSFGTTTNISNSYSREKIIAKNEMHDEIYNVNLQSIQSQINLHKQHKRITFYKPGEEKRVIQELSNIFSNANDELWVFDTYFTSQKSIGYQRDILNVIFESESKSKIIAFFSNEKNSNIENLKDNLFKDENIERILKYKKLNIIFKQTKDPIHDRFIVAKHNGVVSTYVIGTSFNSLSKNYFCIIKLDKLDSLIIYEELKQLIFDDEFCITKEY